VLFKLLIRGSSCVKGLYGLCRISERRESRIPEKPAKYWRAQRHTTKVARRNSQGLRPDGKPTGISFADRVNELLVRRRWLHLFDYQKLNLPLG